MLNPAAFAVDQRHACAPLRDQLRAATHDVHQRLHGHAGLAAVADATIDRPRYIALLCRLFGFHLPFEAATKCAPERSRWLARDLAALGVDAATRAALPLCPAMKGLGSAEQVVGALYVVEGSALGGRGLARRLDGLLGAGIIDGRRFFIGRGAGTGAAWQLFLAQLGKTAPDSAAASRVTAAATLTFALFEDWLQGWHGTDDGH